MARLIITITHEGDEYALLQLAEVRQQPQESNFKYFMLCEEVHLDVEVASVQCAYWGLVHDLESLDRHTMLILEQHITLFLSLDVGVGVVEFLDAVTSMVLLVVLLALPLRHVEVTILDFECFNRISFESKVLIKCSLTCLAPLYCISCILKL